MSTIYCLTPGAVAWRKREFDLMTTALLPDTAPPSRQVRMARACAVWNDYLNWAEKPEISIDEFHNAFHIDSSGLIYRRWPDGQMACFSTDNHTIRFWLGTGGWIEWTDGKLTVLAARPAPVCGLTADQIIVDDPHPHLDDDRFAGADPFSTATRDIARGS